MILDRRRERPSFAMDFSAASRRGTTLLELCVVLVILSALFVVAIPRLHDARDRAAARSAIQEASSVFSLARREAMTRRAVVGVVIDSVSGSVSVRIGPLILAQQGLRARY